MKAAKLEATKEKAQEKPQTTAQEVVEEKAAKKLNFFPNASDKKINVKKITASGSDKNAFVHKDSGPAAASGFKADIVDPKNKKLQKKDNHYEPEKFSAALEKTETKNINNSMKSIFDKLYEDVMKDDALDLGIQAGPEGEAGDKAEHDLSGGSENTVTIKLDKDLAQKLHDVLMAVLGGEAEGEAESETEGESEDNQEVAGESIAIDQAEERGTPVSGTVKGGESTSPKGQANVVKGTVTGAAKAGKGGEGDVNNPIDGSGKSFGHALVGSGVKGGDATSTKSRANVVNSVIKGGGKGDQSLFQSN
jgi:hypothetical protein